MKLQIGTTTKYIEHEDCTWWEVLEIFIKMMRVEGYIFDDAETINRLDEQLKTGVREALYSEAYDDALKHLKGMSYDDYTETMIDAYNSKRTYSSDKEYK